MDIRVICVGDELLTGDTVNTNLAFIGDRLAQLGLAIQGELCVPDDEYRILEALRLCQTADVVIIVGGLGPTLDDLTRPTVAKFLGRELRLDPAVRDGIRAYLGARAATLPAAAFDTQAQIPDGAQIMPNHNGTAPGLLLRSGNTAWALLPGPPRELIPMFNQEFLPAILPQAQPDWDAVTLHVCGMPESAVEKLVRETLGPSCGLHLAFCIKNDNIMVRLSQPCSCSHDLQEQAVQALRNAFGFRLMPPRFQTAAEYLGALLTERRLTIATAESCTGGGVAAALTDVPGASNWFHGALVTYANEWKTLLLRVPGQTLAEHGAVSEPTVHAMLDGLLKNYPADLGIATSGIAGPGGGTPDKPVGTVVIGVASSAWRDVQTFHFHGLRDAIRSRTTATAINLMLANLLNH
ncbi:MAG: CinA family nicotinamide mononucleotide deamidase-related protein [Lentisphaeria bacterium]|nr:CinA family nicotinamide mononucleotide deamidase-related protein [Lentisphaeria bacterium]